MTGNSFNIVNKADDTTRFWNGDGSAGGGLTGGGDGTWNGTATNWTKYDGTDALGWTADDFAVFGGAAGNVHVGTLGVKTSGMQFTTDGYNIGCGTGTSCHGATSVITLDGTGTDMPTIDVGNGRSTGKNMTATIDAVLAGAKGLNKTDYGMLVLNGTNTYTGGTKVTQGTLQLGNGGTTGSVPGDVAVDAYATLAFDRSDAFDFDGVISGDGRVLQNGTGTVTLKGVNTFTGGLDIASGTVNAGGTSAFGAGVLDISAGATADLNGNDVTLGSVSGSGIVKLGDKELTMTAGGGEVFAGTMTGDDASALDVTGDWIVSGDVTAGTVAVNSGLQIGNRRYQSRRCRCKAHLRPLQRLYAGKRRYRHGWQGRAGRRRQDDPHRHFRLRR